MEKWKIKITQENQEFLENWLKENNHKYKFYEKSWAVSVGDYFFSENLISDFHSSYNADRLEGYILLDSIEGLEINSSPLIFN